MKNCLVSLLALGFSLVALPFLGGCTQQNTGGSNPFVSSASAETITGENVLTVVTETVTNATAAATEAPTNLVADTNSLILAQTNTAATETALSEPVPPTEQKPPSNLQLSPVLSEAVKLVQSEVDQSVLFNFITNTTGYFMLGADEIVYLNDLGVEGNVITMMMEHDKELRELRANAWQAAQAAASNQATQEMVPLEQPESDVAAAPSYVEPPPMEAEPVYASNSYFYDTLSPYGSWVYVPGYGRCWRPTVACKPGWRPYVDRGRWVYSDSGWYWLSDYTWGATTFHYGRWFNDSRQGWCWWPDTVWAPSWVSWRYTSDYCGWAPLPPNCHYQSGFGLMYSSGYAGVSFGFGLGYSSYAFVPWGTFCSPRPYQHCLPASRAVHAYNHSRPYNRWEGGGKGKAYNRGLAPERVRELSRTDVKTVSLQEQNGRNLRAERIERDGRTLTVRRPQFTSSPTEVAGGTPTPLDRRQSVTPRASEPAVSTPQRPVSPATSTLAPSTTARLDTRNQRTQSITTGTRPVAPVTPVNSSTVASKPPVATPQLENRIDRRADTETVGRPRTTAPVTRPTRPQPNSEPVATVTEARSTETKAPEPRTIQPNRQTTRPAAPAQRSSIVVIGSGNNNRSGGGRDYSVWSTPSQPSPTPAPSSPRENASPRTAPPAAVNTPAVTENSSALVTRAQNGNGQNRGSNRGASETYSPPQTGQVIGSNTRSAPQGNYSARQTQSAPAQNNNARPAQSSAAQNNTARPQPSAQPAAARVESRPAPTQTRSSAPGTSSTGQVQGRPNR